MSVENNVTETTSAFNFDITLKVNNSVVSSFTKDIDVEVYVGPNIGIESVTHNGVEISADDYTYNPTTGIISFKTKTFSPFTVTYYDLPQGPVRIGKVGYSSFYNALMAFDSFEVKKATITLMEDCEYNLNNERYAITNGMELTIDLNGHLLNHTNDDRYTYLWATDGGTLNIVDYSINKGGEFKTVISSGDLVNVSGASNFSAKNVKLTCYNKTLTCGGSSNVTLDNVIITVPNGNYSAAFNFSSSGTLELKNSTLIGSPAIQLNEACSVTIDNCDLRGGNTSIVSIQNNSSTTPVQISNSRLSVREGFKLQNGLYLQSNAKAVNVNNCIIDMGNSTHTNQYAIHLVSEGTTTLTMTDSEVRNVVGYGIVMDMDGYGSAIFNNTKITSTEETVEMDHAQGNTTFNEGCIINTSAEDFYYTVNGSMTTVNPGVIFNINPGESNYKCTINGTVVDRGDGTWIIE